MIVKEVHKLNNDIMMYVQYHNSGYIPEGYNIKAGKVSDGVGEAYILSDPRYFDGMYVCNEGDVINVTFEGET